MNVKPEELKDIMENPAPKNKITQITSVIIHYFQ